MKLLLQDTDLNVYLEKHPRGIAPNNVKVGDLHTDCVKPLHNALKGISE